MRVPGKKILQKIVRPIATTIRPGGLILGYHRIADEAWDPLGICVSPANFRQQLEALTELFTPVSLRTLVSNLNDGRDVRDMVALTFDDGYRDFIDNALPELERMSIPATVFIATRFIGKHYWWDEIARHFQPGNQASSRPAHSLGDGTDRHSSSDRNGKHGAALAAQRLSRELSRSDESEREHAIEELHREGKDSRDREKLPGTMSAEEIHVLSDLDNIEIGSHTVTHPVLADLDIVRQRREIAQSKYEIEEIIGSKRVKAFSYPNGSCSEQTRREVAKAGYDYACGSQQDVVRKDVDIYFLPRVWVPNSGYREFRNWITVWRGLRRRTNSGHRSPSNVDRDFQR